MPYYEDEQEYYGAQEYRHVYSPPQFYYPFGPFRIATTLMLFVTAGILLLSVLCALSYVSEVAEEYPSLARTTLKVLIVANLVIHTLILGVDRISWWRSCISIVVNLLYLRLMRTFPFVPSVTSLPVLAVGCMVVIESVMWYWMAVKMMAYTPTYTLVAFFVMLWLVPFGLLASCVPEEECLPGMGMGTSTKSGGASIGGSTASERRPRTMYNRLLSFFRNGGDAV